MQTKPNSNKRNKSEEQKNKIKRNYQELENKHSDMKKSVKKYIEEESDNKKKQEESNKIKGGFNEIEVKKDSNFVIRKPNEENNEKYNSDSYFATLFAQSLLKVCGESTITIGKYDDKNNNNFMYMDKADGNLMNYYNQEPSNINRAFVRNFIEYFNTNYFVDDNRYIEKSYPGDLKFILEYAGEYSDVVPIFQTIARHLCKIFLFQMYDRKSQNILYFDRKPQNILYFDKKDKKNNKEQEFVKKPKFVEIDFDDNEYITCLFSLPTSKNEQDKSVCNNERLKQMRKLVSKYENFIEVIKDKDKTIKEDDHKKLKFWTDIFSEQVINYTITEDKMIRLIREVAKKSKYFGLSKKEIIEGIKNKITSFQTMLEDKDNEKLFEKDKNDKEDYMKLIRESRSTTNETLEQFIKIPNRIEEIVNHELDGQDFYLLSQHDYSKHSRDDTNKKTGQLNDQKVLQKFRKKFESPVKLENKSVNNCSLCSEEQTDECSCCVIN